MLVLKIMGFISVLGFLYWVITTLNNKVIKKFNHDFLDSGNFIIAFISNLFIYFGHMWYVEAITKSGDVLNGILIMGIGGLGLLLLITLNIKMTNFLVGLTGSLIQITLFGIASFFAFFVIFIVIAFFANARPVYNINN